MKHGMMPRRTLLAGAAAAAILFLATGCGGDDEMAGMDHGGSSGDAAASTAPGSGTFNDADVAFVQNMIPHHKQAIEMAELAAKRAGDTEVKKLAEQVKAAQDPQIQTLTGWLTAWGKPTEPSGGHEGMAMPGMMGESEMSQLKAAKGKEFDRMFAQAMISHHNGSIQMARDERANGTNAQAKALAMAIEKTQADEVSTLEKILDRL